MEEEVSSDIPLEDLLGSLHIENGIKKLDLIKSNIYLKQRH
jgi:hypothetical protein